MNRTRIQCPTPGIYQNVPFATYQQWDAVNPSLAKQMRTSAANYRHFECEAPDNDSAAFALGRATHCCVYEPDDFPLRYVVWDGGRRQGKEWEAFKSANCGKSIISIDDYRDAVAMRDAVRSHPAAKSLFTVPAEIESVIVWDDPTTGIRCKGRPDYLGVRLNDLKTTRSLSEHSLMRDVAAYGYHVSMAAYQSGISILKGELIEAVLLFVCKAPPFEVMVRPLSDEAMQRGFDIWQECLTRIAECRESGVWPGIAPDEFPLDLPRWEMGTPDDVQLTLGGTALEEVANG